jgi:hypothetical protein
MNRLLAARLDAVSAGFFVIPEHARHLDGLAAYNPK